MGRIRIHLPTHKVESLLAYLVLHPGPHAREKLAALFWGDSSDQQARNSLRNAFAVLHKYLGDDLLTTSRETAQWNEDFSLWVDAVEFISQKDIAPLAAVELYRGALLTDFYDDWIAAERESYRELYIETLLRVVQQFRARSEYERAIEFALKVLKEDATDERAHQSLIFCYASTGNRQAAIHQYEECKRTLRQELDILPSPETHALYQWILQQHSSYPGLEARLTNLPVPLTSFIGRQQEIAKVKEHLQAARLLTLTGAGGSGKTRLAIQVAHELLDSFKHGVWWVELAALTHPELVPQAVAKALGVQENVQQPLTATLTQHMQSKHLLLVIDNCEHLLPACIQLVTILLSTCPGVQILATSIERLGVPGEQVWQIPTLRLPEVQATSIADLLRNYESVRLFYERAIAVNPGFTLTEQNISNVIEICRRLDGIPLAIEMAAARVQVLSVQEIAKRLDERFQLLTTGDRIAFPRHQTLQALIDWSYSLLSADERMFLHRLSIFAGGFTLEAAEKVCAHNTLQRGQILDLLSRLISKSLVTMDVRDGIARYGMLESIRHYAFGKLCETGEGKTLRRFHLEYYLSLAQEINLQLGGGGQLIGLNRLEAEQDNLRLALAAGQEHELGLGLQLATVLWQFWILRGYLTEGYEAFQSLLAKAPQRSQRRANALMSLAAVSFRLGPNRMVEALLEESLSIYQELNDGQGCIRTYQFLGSLILFNSDDHERAWHYFEQSLAHSLNIGSKAGAAISTYLLGVLFEAEGDTGNARKLMNESLVRFHGLDNQPDICSIFINIGWMGIGHLRWQVVDEETILLLRQIGTRSAIAYTLANLGTLARSEGDYPRARELLEQSLAEFHAAGDRSGIGQVLSQLGNLARVAGDFPQAKTYLQASLDLRREIGEQRGIGRTLCSLGYLAAAENNYELAYEYLNQSLELFQKMQDKPGLAATLSHLGNMAFAQGEYARAELLYSESCSFFRELGTNHGVVINILRLADCAWLVDNPSLARSRLEECLKILQKMRHEPAIAFVTEELRKLGNELADHTV